jgi:8-oxo-dGTP pyrophosphatase MutT (NUDIX family)
MEISDKDLYFVAVKVLENDGKFLIMKDGFGQWDIPGGRIKKDEFEVPLEQVVTRKLKEEIGSNVEYKLEKPTIFMRHERVESAPGNPTVRIFALGYRAKFISGNVELTSHHTEIFWADPKNFDPKQYFTGGWLKGVQEYIDLVKS